MTSIQLRASVATGILLVALTVLVGVRFDPVIDLDHEVARHAYDATFGHQAWLGLWEWLTTWGAPGIVRVVMLAGAVGLALARRWTLAVWLVVLTVVEGLVAPVSKLVLDRPRPHWADPIATAGSTSFPSGHATAAMTAAVAVLLLARRFGTGPLVRGLLPALALAGAAAVAASRVFLGVHYLSDVVGGSLLGAGLALSTYALTERVARAIAVSRAPGSPRRTATGPATGSR